MQRPALTFFLFAPVPSVLTAQVATVLTGVYVTDPAHTGLSWRISHFGLSSFTARFTGVEGTAQPECGDAPELGPEGQHRPGLGEH